MGLQTIQLNEDQHYQLHHAEDGWSWTGLGIFAGHQSDSFYTTGDIARDNAKRSLLQLLGADLTAAANQSTVSVSEPADPNYVLGADYEIAAIGQLYHWEGLASGRGYEDYCSEDGWPTVAQAQCDCFYCLASVDGLGHDKIVEQLRNYEHFTKEVIQACVAENLEHPPLPEF